MGHRFPIRTKLVGGAIALLFPIALFLFYYYPHRWERAATRALSQRTTSTAALAALGVGQGIRRNDYSLIAATLGWVRDDSALAYVVAVDSLGEVFAEHNPAKIDLQIAAEVGRTGVEVEGNVLRASAPIPLGGRREGRLLLGFSLAEVDAAVARDRVAALLVSLGVLLAGSLLATLIAHRFATPVVKLRNVTQRVAAGDYTVSLASDGERGDEIADLTEAFARMLDTIREKTALLEAQAGELAQARDEAVAASRAKSDFLAAMSHEIRTPMNGVMGMLQLLQFSQLNAQQTERVNLAYRSADSLLAIINSILDFSKIEAGKVELERVPFDLHETATDVIALFQEHAAQKRLRLLTRIDPQVPAGLIGDAGRLRQILVNLIGNALKFTTEGQVSLGVRRLPALDGTIALRFEVQDTGVGIPATAIGKLFRSFEQADASTTRKFGGTGLGLAIAKSLAELMGGEMGVSSEEGKGSTFWFTARFAAVPAAVPASPDLSAAH